LQIQNNGLALRLPEALRLARDVTRGTLAASSPADQLRDKLFLAVHDGEWSCSSTLKLRDHRRFVNVVLREGRLTSTLTAEELSQWNQSDGDSLSVPEILTARIPEILAGLRKETANEDREIRAILRTLIYPQKEPRGRNWGIPRVQPPRKNRL
jgi:hypothetical protein